MENLLLTGPHGMRHLLNRHGQPLKSRSTFREVTCLVEVGISLLPSRPSCEVNQASERSSERKIVEYQLALDN